MSCNATGWCPISLIIKKITYSRVSGDSDNLKAFLIEKSNQDLSAQSIREQYILKQRELGVDIARGGPKTMVTLEKYKWILK